MSDTPSSRSVDSRPPPLAVAAVFILYVLTGKLGLRLAIVNASASAVWPPTGIAFAALLFFGPRLWPAVFAAAFLVNWTTAGTVLTSLGIAAGNTLEAVVSAGLVARFANGGEVFERPRNVFKFAALAGLLSTTISPSIGVTSLWLGGFVGPAEFGTIWRTWWLGDVGGALVVGPLALSWLTRPRPLEWTAPRILEGLLLLLSLVAVGMLAFGDLVPQLHGYPLTFVALPLLTWAALRFDIREAATATALLSGIAVWNALAGFGPFASVNDSLLLLAVYLGVISLTTLALGATVLQRRNAEATLATVAAIVESSDDAIIGKTAEGIITSWNRGAERLYGYSAAEAVGRHISMLAPPELEDEIPRLMERVRRGERIEQIETERLRRDGGRVPIGLTVSPIRIGSKLIGASSIARDISRRRRSEQRLATQFAVTHVLAASVTLEQAAPGLLRALCLGLGWAGGELWSNGSPRVLLGAFPAVAADGPPAGAAEVAPDLAAAALASGRPLAVTDLTQDPEWSKSRAALLGFRGAQAWPLYVDGEATACLVLVSDVARSQPRDLINLMNDVVTRLAHFLERRRALVHLERLEKAVETIQMGVTVTDSLGRILYTNPAEAAMHGYRPEELIGKHVSFFMPRGWTPARGRPAEIRSWRRETVNVRRDGSVFPVQLLSDAVVGPDGKPAAFVTCTEEITDRKRAEEALRSSEERYRLLFERNLAGVYRGTRDGRLLECNDAFARILGYASREEVLALSNLDLYVDPEQREAALLRLVESGRLTNCELRLRRKDGGIVWVLENETLLRGEAAAEVVEGTLIDITDRKEFEQRIEFHAYHDPLTGLPNRAYLTDQLRTRLLDARSRGRGLAVLFLDLDHFKVVNDTLGHSLGDRLLQQVAARLRECVREDDVVVRMGGDEFVLLLPRMRHGGPLDVARKILARLEEPVRLDEHELCLTASIGIARFPDDGEDVDTLLKNADSAMYRAKQVGRNTCQEWDAAAPSGPGDRLATQARLRRAVERGEMEVWYQPQLALGSGSIVGVEALLRWRHPDRGIVLPAEFIPIAEESGLIVPLGEWVLREACTAARRWQARGLPPLRVGVNLSVRQFQQPGLVATVARILQETGLPPDRLELEITETLAMQNADVSVPVLRELAAMGVSVSIDDFGVGYSSLSYLKLLPIRRLKLDRSFIAGIGHEPRDAAIVKAVVRMAGSLELGVVAEGVETEEQLAMLGELGCDEMQGFVFRGAVPADALEELLASASPVRRAG